MATQRSKFLQWIDFRIRVTVQDGRMMVGTFLAFDKHMNVVLADTEEYRITKSSKTGVQKQIKRTLGLIIIRGQNIVSLTAEAPPSQTHKKADTQKVGKVQAITRASNVPQMKTEQPTLVMPKNTNPKPPKMAPM